jgi:hypothetical protein
VVVELAGENSLGGSSEGSVPLRRDGMAAAAEVLGGSSANRL